MSVKHLVLPAAEEAEPMWTNKLGFRKTSNDEVSLLSLMGNLSSSLAFFSLCYELLSVMWKQYLCIPYGEFLGLWCSVYFYDTG